MLILAEFRQWREEKRTFLKDVVPLDTPFNLHIEVSSLCNAKCVYCAHSKPDHGVWEGNMSLELFEKVVEEAKKFPKKIKLFDMFGFGEPLCNPNLAKMIEIARKSEVVQKINFTTNGLLFTPEKIDAILAAGVDTIRISLQGLNAEAYSKVCGVKVDFMHFLETLKYLFENRRGGGIPCKVRMKIADLAIKDVENGREKFEELFGNIADSIFVETIIPMYSDVDYNTLDKGIYERAIHGRENVKQTKINKVCHRPFYRLRIGANGDVTAACCDIPHDIYYGNINKDSLVDLWNKGTHPSFLKMQLKGERFKHPICKTCTMPNDITNEADLLDPYAKSILRKMEVAIV